MTDSRSQVCAPTLHMLDRSARHGALAWAVALLVLWPNPLGVGWAKLLLLMGPLIIVPLGLRCVGRPEVDAVSRRLWPVVVDLQFMAALLFSVAFVMDQCLAAVVLAAPWATLTWLMAAMGLARIWQRRRGPGHEFCVAAGLIYIAIGSGWALLDRAAIQPLGFKPEIVLLTAVHFHFAGFALPLMTGLAMRRVGGRTAKLAAVGVIVGIPFVAVGITATQLEFDRWVEFGAASLMSATGLLVGWLHIRLANQSDQPAVIRCLWLVTGVSLSCSMVLSAMYGARWYLPLEWLDIPWMRALHGTANAFGFGLIGMIAWRLAEWHSECSASAMERDPFEPGALFT